MAEKILNTRIVMRSGTTAEWNTNDFVLKPGEVGIEFSVDGSTKMEVGDSIGTDWKILPYFEGIETFTDETTLHLK